MSSFDFIQVTDPVSQAEAAVAATDVMRLGETQALISGCAPLHHTHVLADITDFAAAGGGAIFNLLENTDTLVWYQAGAFLSGVVRLKAAGGVLSSPGQGLTLDFAKVSVPGHQHVVADITDFPAQLGSALSFALVNTPSLVWQAGPGGTFSGIVQTQSNGGLLSGAGGLAVDFGTAGTQAAQGNHTHAQLHDVFALGFTSSLVWSLADQTLAADVWLAATGGLRLNSGVGCNWGNEHFQVPFGDHTHSGMHLPVSVVNTPSVTLWCDAMAQVLSGVVNRRAPGSLAGNQGQVYCGSDGLYLQFGTGANDPAAGNHTHSDATESADGFMSAADKTRLDNLVANAVLSVNTLTGAVVLTTTNIAEGTNLYYTTTRAKADALAAALTGFSAATGGNVSSADTILSALGRLENRMEINDAKGGGSGGMPLTGGVFTGGISFSGTTNPGVTLSGLTSAQRTALAAVNGMVIFNSTTGLLEYYNGGWVAVAAGGAYLTLAGGTLTGPVNFSGTTNPGLQLSNLTTAQRNALGMPLAGQVVYNTTTGQVEFYNGSAWVAAGAGLYLGIGGGTLTGPVSFLGATNPGLMLNNLTTTQRNALSAPAAGMLIFNTTTGLVEFYSGSAWAAVANTSGLPTTGGTMTGGIAFQAGMTDCIDWSGGFLTSVNTGTSTWSLWFGASGTTGYVQVRPSTTVLGVGHYDLGTTAGGIFCSDALYVAGSQLVGARQAPITNADGTLAGATAAINNILAMLRSHGLIGT